MASLLDLQEKLKNLFNQGVSTVQNIKSPNIRSTTPNALGQKVFNTIGKFNPVDAVPFVAQPIKQFVKPFVPTVGEYAQGQVMKPIQEGIQTAGDANKQWYERALGGLQAGFGGFSATPAGALFNAGYGATAGALRSLRTGQDIRQSIRTGISNPSDIGGTGLGLDPVPALLVDTVTGNPKMALKVFQNLRTVKGLQGLSPNAFNIHPQDEKVLNVLMDKVLSKAKLQKLDNDNLQALASHYLGGEYKGADNRTIALAFQNLLGKKRGGIVGDVPPAYKMGFVETPKISDDLGDALAGAGSPDDEIKIIGEFIDNALHNAKGNSLKATRAALQKELARIAGEPGNYKASYAVQQVLKDSPDVGPRINAIEEGIARIDERLKQPISSEGRVVKEGIRVNAVPTQTEIRNRMEVDSGNPDLYTQRKMKIEQAFKNPDIPVQDQLANQGEKFQPTQQRVPVRVKKSQVAYPESNFDSTTFSSNESIPHSIPGDIASQTRAEANTLTANEGKGGIGGLIPEARKAFEDWVNTRRASKVEGTLKGKEFEDLNSRGIEGIFEFQSGNKTGRFAEVKKYFDDKYRELTKNGIDINYKKDYLPQLWADAEERINQVFGRSLGTRPSFTLESLIKNYQEGIKARLTPRFNNISDLAAWYEQRANKALADKGFFTYLGKNGFLAPSGKAPQGWVTLSPDRFPKIKVSIDGMAHSGVYQAPPELAKLINNYLNDPQFELLNQIANYVSRAKNVTLSFGIPGTAINAHGINILARHTLFGTGGNPISRFLTGAHYLFNQHASGTYLNKTLSQAPQAVRNGLTLSAEEHTALLNESERVAKSLGKAWNKVFEVPLFNKMLPALKLSSYQELVKNGMDGKVAAKLVNNVYGGINWEQLGRNRDTQNLFRTLILAPDWAETTVRLGGNIGKAFTPWAKGETANRYRTMTATLLGSVVMGNIVNKLTSGHYMYENDPGHTMEIQVGYTEDGTKRYLRPYGTAVDFLRLPYDVTLGLAKGDPSAAFRVISNRLSIPLSSAMHLLTNTDYKGDAIYGRDKFGGEMSPLQSVGGIGSEALGLIGFPSFAKNAIDYATGKQGGEQALTGAFELPFRYQGPGNSKTQKFVGDTLGLKGKELYDTKKRFQGESPFSENQQTLIREGGAPILNEIMQNREQERVFKKADKLQEQAVNGEISKEEAQNAIDELLKTSAPEAKKSSMHTSDVNKAYAAETTNTFNTEFIERSAKNQVKLTGKPQMVQGKIYYPSSNGVKTIDLNPPTKGDGIDAFTNQSWNINKALQVYKADLPQDQKDAAYKKLGVDSTQLEYAYKASHSEDVKTQYVTSKASSMSHDDLVNELIKGRVVSAAGDQFASNGVIDNLRDQGYLSKQEATALKKIKVDKDGKSLVKTGGTSKKGKATIKKVKPAKINLSKFTKRKAPTLKLSKSRVVTKAKVAKFKLTTPSAKISYKVVGPSKVKGLTNAVQLA